MDLRHYSFECAGRWRPYSISSLLFWRCDRCAAVYYESDAVARAALREHVLGLQLRALEQEGRELLRSRPRL